jgi:hypothetical protein
MRKTINALTKSLQKINFVSRFFNGFPEPDLNVKGYFLDKELIEPVEQSEISPYVFVAPFIEYQITDLRLLFPV